MQTDIYMATKRASASNMQGFVVHGSWGLVQALWFKPFNQRQDTTESDYSVFGTVCVQIQNPGQNLSDSFQISSDLCN